MEQVATSLSDPDLAMAGQERLTAVGGGMSRPGLGAVVLPSIPGLLLAPGRGGEPDGRDGGGAGGVTGNAEPEWKDKNSGEGFGAGGGSHFGTDGVVVIFT